MLNNYNDEYQNIAVNQKGSKLTITLNNPKVHNRLSSADIDYLIDVLAKVDLDYSIQVLVLTGAGKSFCAGFDINELDGMADKATLPKFDVLTDKMEQSRCATICAVNGGVYGGGVDLALACDFRVVINTAELLMPAARIGLHYYPSGIRRYVSRLGVASTKRLLLCADSVKSDQLVDIGFADELVAPEEFISSVDVLGQQIQGNAPLAVEGMKLAINTYGNSQVDEEQVYAAYKLALQSNDFKVGIQSVINKSKPEFKRD